MRQPLFPRRAETRTYLRFDSFNQTFIVTRTVVANHRSEPFRSVARESDLRSIGDMDIDEVLDRAKYDPNHDHVLQSRKSKRTGLVGGFAL